jgi:hypothetical protein
MMDGDNDLEGRRIRSTTAPPPVPRTFLEAIIGFRTARNFLAGKKEFNTDTFERVQAQHREQHKIRDDTPQKAETNSTGSKGGTVILNMVPLFSLGDHSFFYHPEDTTNTVYSHSRPDSKKRMREDGFVEYKNVVHYAGEEVPKSPPKKSKIANLPLLDRTAPSELLVPDCSKNSKLPDMYIEGDETTAAAIVRIFEDKYIDKSTERIYSPIKQWTDEALENATIKNNNWSKITKWAYAYIAISNTTEKPAEIKKT